MEPSIDTTQLFTDFGPAGLTVALVAAIRRAVPLTGLGSVLVTALVATAAVLAVDWADGVIVAHTLPLETLKASLMAMGAWSGTKNAMGK